MKGENILAEERIFQACIPEADPTPLPADPVPGMAYVPFQQWNDSLHSVERALDAGTLFPVLDLPFYGRKGGEPR